MAYKLICTVQMHGYAKGAEVTDPDRVERLSQTHPHHFVRVSTPDAPAEPAPAREPDKPAK